MSAVNLIELGSEAPPVPLLPGPTQEERLVLERENMIASRFQAKAALLQAGHLSAVEAAVANADTLTQLAWAEAVELRRASPMIATLAQAIGLSDEDVDELFRVAMQIEA